MKKMKMNLLLLFSALFLVACGQEQSIKPSSSDTNDAKTEQQVETQSESKETETTENKEETEPAEEPSKEEIQEQVITRIMDHLEKTENVNREHVMVLISEQEGYEDYEARENNPDDPNVTHLLGMYRYYPEEDKLEVYNTNTDTYEAVE